MKKLLVLIIVFAACALAQAQVELHGRVHAFARQFSDEDIRSHGTQPGEEADTSSFDSLSMPDYFQVSRPNAESFCSKFRKSTFNEFRVEPQKYSLQDIKAFQKKPTLKNATFEIGTDEELLLSFSLNKQNKSGGIQGIAEYRKIALRAIRKCIPWIGRDIEYENYYQEYKNDKLDTVEIRFRRVFEGGVVRGNISYVRVHLDTCGNVCSMILKWPKFVPLINNHDQLVSILDACAKARQIIQDRYTVIVKEDQGGKFHLKHGLVDGVSVGWFPSDVTGSIVLTPCYSFGFDVNYFEDDVKVSDIIDIPIFLRYHE